MIIFLNTKAAGGKALARWEKIEPEITRRFPDAEVFATRLPSDVSRLLPCLVSRGHTHFVAAGGDGSLNQLLNAVMRLPERIRSTVTIGAIGLGSSNDFHKPMRQDRIISGIPFNIDPASARTRDVGMLTILSNHTRIRKYFLVNASIGLTAEANRLFNSKDRVLRFLKTRSTPLAILYAAVRTLCTYKDKSVSVALNGNGTTHVRLTNLAIMKSPHVSGDFEFPVRPHFTNGMFAMCLAHNMRHGERLRMLLSLLCKSLSPSRKIQIWSAPGLTIQSSKPFSIEFDGEIMQGSRVTFSNLTNHLQVCTC
jgi:diacylglycerol kinase (ATP)